jgi:predicted nucleic acid-binding protein
MGCTTVYSEDLNAGQTYDGVVVVNPFAAAAM